MSSENLRGLLDQLEDTLTDYVEDEKSRVEAERDFLLAVVDGRSDGVNVENVSSELTSTYLASSLSKYIPIEDDS